MAHDEHFLRRLDRVSDHHVELSLTLYRDQELLRDVLARAELPEGAQRLAISLEDPLEGPFVIVTREGRFVTCLAKGMMVSADLLVMPRKLLDAAIAKVERMRERVALADTLRSQGGEGIAGRLYRRMFDEGLRFCREDAETLLQVWPLIGRGAAFECDRLCTSLRASRDRVAALRFNKLKPHEADSVAMFGCAAWAAAHLVVLTSEPESSKALDELDAARGVDVRLGHARTLFELGSHAHALRVLWSTASRQKPLASIKGLRGTNEIESLILREFGLGVIAMRSSMYRAEAIKEMGRLSPMPPPDALKEVLFEHRVGRFAGHLSEGVREAVDDEKAHTDFYLRLGRDLAGHCLEHWKASAEAKAMLVTDAIAGAAMPCFPGSWFGEKQRQQRNLQNFVTGLPWLAHAGPTELFLPREFVKHIPITQIADATMMMVPYAETLKLGLPAPVTNTAPALGRNDLCKCGSGKKFKRCCA